MAVTDRAQHYPADRDDWEPGEGEDARAAEHRDRALAALGEDPQAALVHAVLSVAERVSELSYYVARLG
jgi:hypothetical protein